jgi:hypothetical protein
MGYKRYQDKYKNWLNSHQNNKDIIKIVDLLVLMLINKIIDKINQNLIKFQPIL